MDEKVLSVFFSDFIKDVMFNSENKFVMFFLLDSKLYLLTKFKLFSFLTRFIFSKNSDTFFTSLYEFLIVVIGATFDMDSTKSSVFKVS